MKCKRCKADVDVFKPPFGAYFCKENHVQCAACKLSSFKCVCCGEDTKYKSPHCSSEPHSLPKSIKHFESPIVHHVSVTDEDKKEFRKVRSTLTDENDDELICFRNQNDLSSVRTLSALIAKDLYSTGKKYGEDQYDPVERDFRFQKIIQALRETACPYSQDANSAVGDSNKWAESDDALQLKLLYPQESQLRASAIKLTSSNSCTSKIDLTVNTKSDYDLAKSSFEINENCPLNYVDLRSVSCANLTNCPQMGFPISVETVSLDCRPFFCPIDKCVGKIFASDFIKHIINNHPTLPFSQMKVGEFKELFVDVKDCSEIPQCVLCFLMCDVVKNYSSPPLKDTLPMLLMIGRYRYLTNESGVLSGTGPWSNLDSMLVWLVGIVPEHIEISVGISVSSKIDSKISRFYIDNLNSIHSSTNVEGIFQTARRIVISFREVQKLTNNFKESLHCQIGLISLTIKDI